MTITLDGTALWVLIGLLLAGWTLAYAFLRAWRKAKRAARQARSAKQSQATRYGQLSEQFAPLMEHWPFHARAGFRFLGSPIDGVQFTEDAVYLVEIKAAGSRLTKDQRRIRDHVEAGRVGWAEVRIDEDSEARFVEPWR